MLQLVVGIAVGVLVLSAALFPVIDSATTTERTFTNEGLYYMSYVPENDSHELVFTPGSGWTFDGEPFTDVPGDYTILGTDDLVIRGDGRARGILSATGTVAIDFTVTNTAITGTFGTQTMNLTYDKIILAVPDKSNLIMKAGTTTAYVLNESSIEAYGYTSITTSSEWTNNMVIHIDGDLKDGFTITAYPTGSGVTVDYTVENITTDAAAVTDYIGLYKITTIEFDIVVTNSDENAEYTTHCTYNRVIVPTTVTAELAVHASQDEIEILETIPILITVGLILGIVGAVFVRRLE